MINYRILPEQKLIAIYHWGKTSVEEILKFSRDLRTDPDFFQSYDTILYKPWVEDALFGDDIHKLSSSRVDTSKPAGKIAIIAPADITYGTSRMYELKIETESPNKIHVFRDIGSALKWLDREGLDIENIFEEIRREKT